MIVNLGSKENKESTWKDSFGIILCNKNVERMVFVTKDGGKTTQDGERRFFHDGNNLKTPVSNS